MGKNLLISAFDNFNFGFIICAHGKIEYLNKKLSELINIPRHKLKNKECDDVLPEFRLTEVFLTGRSLMGEIVNINDYTLIVNAHKFKSNKQDKVIAIAQSLNDLDNIANQLPAVKELNMDIKAIFEASYDVIYVSNGAGTTLRVSSACERLFGVKPEELIGKNVRDAEKQNIYKPSATRLALEKKQKVSLVQETKCGKRLLVVSIPIFNENGEIVRVVNASRDITELNKLQEELEETKNLVQEYKREVLQLKKEKESHDKLIFKSPQMEDLVNFAIKVADVNSTVLITGESGVGKEVFAKTIHDSSPRKNEVFVKINCGAIPENLLESELFGYEKGAFTGAYKRKLGLFEQANHGTIFLDEIGDLPLPLQVKLLRVLQEKEFTRIGGTETIKVDVRIIAATNKDLKEMVKEGKFREDLYYRLDVLPLHIPPLRERREDIPLLINNFLAKYNQIHVKDLKISNEAMEALISYDWPGNVRELENIIERVIITTDNNFVKLEDLPGGFRQNIAPISIHVSEIMPLKEALEVVEERLVNLAMEKYKTTTAAAKALGISQASVSRKLKKMRFLPHF